MSSGLGYLANPAMHGYQPPNRWAGNRSMTGPMFHAYGCRVDGGDGLPAGACLKCEADLVGEYVNALERIDRRTR